MTTPGMDGSRLGPPLPPLLCVDGSILKKTASYLYWCQRRATQSCCMSEHHSLSSIHLRRPRPAPIGVRKAAEVRWVRRGPFSLKFRFLNVFGLRSGPDGSGQAVGFIWSLFRAKPSILDPFRTKFDVFGPDRTLADVADMPRRDPTSPDG